MYLPTDLGRAPIKTNGPSQFQILLNTNICPIQTIDPNAVYKPSESDFSFENLDGLYKPDIGIRVSRSQLLQDDPNTYVAFSKFVEQNLRKYHTTLGNLNHNLMTTPVTLPPETVGAHDGKTEILPIGCSINPLVSDPFRNVHLTPGCITTIVPLDETPHSSNANGKGFSGKIWGKKSDKQGHGSHIDGLDFLKQPRSSLSRTTSNFVAKVATADNMSKKLNMAKSVLIAGHGRLINVINLSPNPKEMEVDAPLLRVTLTVGVITCVSTFKYVTSTGEKNLDVLVGLSTGDIIWFNPFRMKYSRWNKNAKLIRKSVMSLAWSRCGRFAIAGFSNGEVMTFKRDQEDEENYSHHVDVLKKNKYMRWFRSGETAHEANPASHIKLCTRAITSIKIHPHLHNLAVITSDDGFFRIMDLQREFITDVVPSYYGGLLCSEITSDGKYLLVGGEDDFVAIYEFLLSSAQSSFQGTVKLVGRLQGSASWVRGVTIDEFKTTNGILYRIGSVSDDGRLQLYEFQPRNLPKVKKAVNLQPRAEEIENGNASRMQLTSTESINDGSTGTAVTLAQRKRFALNRQKRSDSVSSLTSSTAQQQLSIIELIKSTSQVSLTSAEHHANGYGNANLSNALFKSSTNQEDAMVFGPSKTVVHRVIGVKEVPVVFPIGEDNLKLGRMEGVYFEENYIWVFCSTGDLMRYFRP
ncbi:unnamed protein product [Kuraishia capsulata CBS 1993]|uniref:Uncharacterized protein n=1 Tax=Kuraishia capsulata CBS 1993 TaxID=1382522 RepID=W6MLN1_9ASCO|nr:uncharacterized protein KUCA_T00003384001 [Kuraishia capsulata CBS 1993]CDK27406.1 unnamed protein product [Kuraishia capsulata CBS 1993]